MTDHPPLSSTQPFKKIDDTLQAGDDAAAAVAVAPRVTLESLLAKIDREEYAVFGGVLTVCVLFTVNGFTVTGESACASPENFNEELGRKFARERAVSALWGFEGYLLRERLADERQRVANALVPGRFDMPAYIGTKIVNARPMVRADYVLFRGWEMPANENPDDVGYLVEYTDKLDGNVEGFAGYITWSPADVFERAYHKVGAQPVAFTPDTVPYADLPPHMQRVAVERDELAEKLDKLITFMDTDTFGGLTEEAQLDLVDQQAHMSAYLARLNIRLAR